MLKLTSNYYNSLDRLLTTQTPVHRKHPLCAWYIYMCVFTRISSIIYPYTPIPLYQYYTNYTGTFFVAEHTALSTDSPKVQTKGAGQNSVLLTQARLWAGCKAALLFNKRKLH